MSIKEFDQSTTFSNPDLPSGALSSKQFNTIVELLSEGEIEGSATASQIKLQQHILIVLKKIFF